MTTWTNFASSLGTAVTTWNYDGHRGFLTNKAYADGTGPSYTYTAAGRLQSRLWARQVGGQPLATTYAYDNAGNQAIVNYSDTTPGLGCAFDRLGRLIAVTNGTTISAWTYNDVGHPLSESHIGGPLDGLSVTNAYDNLLRRNNLSVLNGASVLTSVGYAYDADSRLQAVASGAITATYTYIDNSPLVGQIAFANNGQPVMTTTKQYDHLNRLTGISSSSASTSASAFNYAYNSASQRMQVTNTDHSHWVYQYDNLGQVISGKKYWADGTPVAGQQFIYNFDNIGNRDFTASGGDPSGASLRPANYSANNLNQYASRDVPGYAEILGSATPNATITVNLQRAVRQGSYFWDELGVSNASSAVYLSLTNLAVVNSGTNADIVATNTGNLFVPQTPETFGFDADGNLTNSGRWAIAWDGENRAVSFASLPSAPIASQRKVDCAYDFLGRRIQKIVSTNSGSAWIAISTNRYVYDGWNLVAILDPRSSIQQSFTWGKDLSGSLQGAGGVGGLLAMTVCTGPNAGTYDYTYDGNGNVAALAKAASGSLAGQWEYGPFGNLLRASGPLAAVNPFLFSTKFYDLETEFSYYGFRYYDAGAGRWASKDPLEEQGGANLYEFAANDSVNRIDRLGLSGVVTLPPEFLNMEQLEARLIKGALGFGDVAEQEAAIAGTASVTASASLGAAGGLTGTTMMASTALTDVAILMSVALQAEVNAYQAATSQALANFQSTAQAVQTGTQTYSSYKRIPKVQPIEDPCTDCLYYWTHKDDGGNPEHTDYVTRQFPTANVGVVVIAPDGTGASFDAGVPWPFPEIVYELKTGGEYADLPLSSLTLGQISRLTTDTEQFGREEHVASTCLLEFDISV